MEVPEGALEKSWGWLRQVSRDADEEVWYGEVGWNGGATTIHSHKHYRQRLVVVEGAVGVVDHGSNTVRQLQVGETADIEYGVTHQLVFPGRARFIEIYRIGMVDGTTPGTVTEDTVRR
jgi:mannose-6-phosphate isomerase-like protein (cupin superfamily)